MILLISILLTVIALISALIIFSYKEQAKRLAKYKAIEKDIIDFHSQAINKDATIDQLKSLKENLLKYFKTNPVPPSLQYEPAFIHGLIRGRIYEMLRNSNVQQ